ncbi:Alginate biosynthesis transcriptional regulatory protein AlgB [Vibrio aerogenes CECT 7868]|uniref:Alginate biosynthesis transcriptional regulatory protein AlgB n=1 Tax=Vibrio aerogenes CECT 7868 TaxID=1216006 RepID=A0A1M5V6B3_9VIBR|nr:sigma-54 dependent transcriptional regulator [Vibrio aerogenes]SHH70614.1 Alginate biosynthesis transcriptional regulatory protein AlgB [Vibrio aerogenes CECT 7868]
MNNPRILIADDDEHILTTLRLMLKVNGFDIITASTPQQTLASAISAEPDVALIDLNYQLDTTSGQEGFSLISQLQQQVPDLPVIVMTGWGTIDIAVQAMKSGAADFIEKPWDNQQLLHVLHTQLRLRQSLTGQARLKRQNQLLQQQLTPDTDDDLIAVSPAMVALLDTLNAIADSDASLLLTGENGTGKSQLAHYIHRHSTRQEQAFVAVDMSTIPESLFESEMFGHVKGAFTDAKQQRPGRFELADQGTLFLDEIGNTPVSQQSKLLRVLESRQFEKVGSSKTQQVDVRVIAATNADLQQMIGQQTFRQDLFYRLNTFELRIPALRERTEDILPLARHFIRRFARKYQRDIMPDSLSATLVRQLQQYPWPGNIRELSHVIERMVLLCRNDQPDSGLLQQVLPVHQSSVQSASSFQHTPLQQNVTAATGTSPNDALLQTGTLEDIEQQILRQRLDDYHGQANQAAASLGLSRSAFYRRLARSK